MNFLRKILATSPKEAMVTIPSGELFLTRSPNSPKGVQECIFKDAQAVIRRTNTDFHYQLLVQRVYDEGEEGLEDNDDGSDLDDENKDEWTFLIDEALRIRYTSQGDNVVICWDDISGDVGDMFQFVCGTSVKPKDFDNFDQAAKKCQYERKYQKPFSGGEADLEEFDFDSVFVEADEEEAAAATTTTTVANDKEPDSEDEFHDMIQSPPRKKDTPAEAVAPQTPVKQKPQTVPEESMIPNIQGNELYQKNASIHLFDAATGVFIEQAATCVAKLIEVEKFEAWLEVTSNGRKMIGMPINSDMNPVFNFEHASFIFNLFAQSQVFSWLLKFEGFNQLSEFQGAMVKAMWEHNNQKKWEDVEQNYVVDAFTEMEIDDEELSEMSDEMQEPEDEPDRKPQEEVYDEDEDHDEVQKFEGKGKNSSLAVGMKNDRSYVVRGNKIGVFKQTDNNDLEFAATIDNVADTKGEGFAPQKVMLHTQDASMVLQNPNNPDKLYSMDLEYGKVVDEWIVGTEGQQIKSFAPSQKFSQMTGEKTMVGIAKNGVFRIDPRISGINKLVSDEYRRHPSKIDFSSVATNEAGNIAVASMNGEIKLFDRLGIRAKTQLPALGDPIIGLDTSADGRWILATCKSYLLLIDASIKDGKNSGQTGFTKPFAKDSKPRPKRLQIKPEHVAFMQNEAGTPLSFTEAHFNTGIDSKEQTIVTSSGPYVITWSMKKLMRGDKEPYLIKRYAGNVTADNFKFGTDKNVIVALEDDVGMVNRSTFRKPTRESLATPAKRVQALSRNSIVNSPF